MLQATRMLFFLPLMTGCGYYFQDTKNPLKDLGVQKIYVEPSDVQVAEEGILVNLQDQVVLVKNLRSDRNGLLFWIQRSLVLKKAFIVRGVQRIAAMSMTT